MFLFPPPPLKQQATATICVLGDQDNAGSIPGGGFDLFHRSGSEGDPASYVMFFARGKAARA
jgi:hypothetical protein